MENKHTPEEKTEEGIIPFLLGSGKLNGLWFGDVSYPKYWWRKHLREHNASLQSEIDRLKEEKIEMARLLKLCYSEIRTGYDLDGILKKEEQDMNSFLNKLKSFLTRIK